MTNLGDQKSQNDSHVRLFLSMDLSGSTPLKHKRHYQVILQKYRDLTKAVEELQNNGVINVVGSGTNMADQYMRAVLKVFPRSEWDWSDIINERFRDFRSRFQSELSNLGLTDDADNLDLRLWKALGDELLYCFPVEKRINVHYQVTAFLRAIRYMEQDERERDTPIGFKATGWVAGFPVRNRIVEIMDTDLYRLVGPKDNPKYEPHDYPRFDFAGPEMDTGFRLSKCSHPGLMVVSLELAKLLGQTDVKEQVRGGIVGWKVLEGVWKGNPYPIIWISIPASDAKTYKGEEFLPWAKETNAFVAKWIAQRNPKRLMLPEIKEIGDMLGETREALDPDLAVVEPYILSEPQPTDKPEDHKTIKHILDLLEKDHDEQPLNDDIAQPEGEAEIQPSTTTNVINSTSTASLKKRTPKTKKRT